MLQYDRLDKTNFLGDQIHRAAIRRMEKRKLHLVELKGKKVNRLIRLHKDREEQRTTNGQLQREEDGWKDAGRRKDKQTKMEEWHFQNAQKQDSKQGGTQRMKQQASTERATT